MSDKPKILFVYDHAKPEWWQDGLSAALTLLEEDFEIERYNLATDNPPAVVNPDFLLVWGAIGSEQVHWARSMAVSKKGICVAGNATPADEITMREWDVVFHETEWIKKSYLRGVSGPKLVKAFGVNADLFSPPTIPMPIVWDFIGAGAFADWKRWPLMSAKARAGAWCLVVGEYQEGNERESINIVRTLLRDSVMVSNQVSPLDLVNLYYWSRALYMPADINGGGERAVLEARACGLQVEIQNDNPKLQELLELEQVPTHHEYAAALKAGIESVL